MRYLFIIGVIVILLVVLLWVASIFITAIAALFGSTFAVF